MIRDTLFTLLSQRLGNRSDLIPRMATEVQLLQETVLEAHAWLPWFLETEMAETVTVVGEERVQLPVDFLREIEEQALWRVPSEGTTLIPLPKKTYDELVARWAGNGAPLGYALGADYLFVRPVPDDVYTLKMRYMAKDAILDTNIENKWLKNASDVVLAELGVVMAEQHMQHFDLAKSFRANAEVAWNRLYGVHIARQEENMNRKMEA